MILDASILVAYFAVIMAIGVRARTRAGVGTEEYFLSGRSLKWPSIAMSTIATNIHANLEINAIFGILIATFFFVPLYLRMKVVTITQFFDVPHERAF